MAPRKSGGRARPAAPPPNPVPSAYPGKKDGASPGLEEAQWVAVRDMLDAVYKAKEGSRWMADIFRELPDKEEYSDYYEAIPEPECLDNIATHLAAQDYATPEAFFKQLHLVFLNAKHYNEENSQVWNDAEKYATQIHEAWRANAAAGTFAFADPYHKTPRGRKPKSSEPKSAEPKAERSSATPATPAAASPAAVKAEATPAPVTIHLRVPRPEAAAPAQSPPAAASTPARARETRGSRSSVSASSAKASPAQPAPSSAKAAPAPTPPPPPPTTWTGLSAPDAANVNGLDARLERWEGPQNPLPGDPAPGGVPGSGWWGEGAPEFERSVGGSTSYKNRIKSAAEAIEGYRDPQGRILSTVLGRMPQPVDLPYVSHLNSPSFAAILQSARAGKYDTLFAFDLDMTRMFERARRWSQPRPEEYGLVLTLQRLYNAITAPYPMSLGPKGLPGPSATLFASLPVGPGKARTIQDVHDARRAGASEQQAGYGITTNRISQKDRMFTEEARHKGQAYRVGDYVHLINPDDAARPIVGQIFKTFIPTKGYSTHHVTVCWYFRPEQTVHPGDQTFIEREVFKTPHFCDHPVEDIIERVTVQPTDSAARGRPKVPGAFYPGWPLYVCSTRYLDKPQLFLRIKKWSSIIPEGRRHIDVTTVVPYQRPITLPVVKSPFTLGVTGPGALGRPRRQPIPSDSEEDEAEAAYAQPQAPRRDADPRATTAATASATPTPRAPTPASVAGPGPSRPPSAAQAAVQPPRPAAGRTPSTAWRAQPPQQQPTFASRTFASIVGGSQVLEQVAVREYLPPDTARLFAQDARHQVLWFSGPPLAPGAVNIPQPEGHSVEYLAFLAKRRRGVSVAEARPKRRRVAAGAGAGKAVGDGVKVEGGEVKESGEGGEGDAVGEEDAEGEDADGEWEEAEVGGEAGKTEGEGGEAKGEDLRDAWWTKGMSGEQVLESLRAVVG